jgi:DoxX-like family
MNATLEGSGTFSPVDLSMPRSKGIVIGFWLVTALFCLQMGFTAYAQLSLPQVAEAFTRLGFPDYFRVELAWAKLLGVVLLLAPVPARLKEWRTPAAPSTLGSALIAQFAVGDGPEAWGLRGGHRRALGALVLLLASRGGLSGGGQAGGQLPASRLGHDGLCW